LERLGGRGMGVEEVDDVVWEMLCVLCKPDSLW